MATFIPIAGTGRDNGKSYNMERVLRSNILNSDYFVQLSKIEDFMDLVDEIYMLYLEEDRRSLEAFESVKEVTAEQSEGK